MKQSLKQLSIIFFLFINISVAHADENEGIIPKLQEYDVEVIIFEDASARYINSEDWAQETILDRPPAPEESPIKPPENLDTLSIDEINAIDNNDATPFQNIKPEILSKEYKRIDTSMEYNVLFYGSWRQAGLSAEKAFEIDIQQLDNKHDTDSENTINGTLKLVLARYLHIYNKLNYQRKPNISTTEQAVKNTDTDTPPGESTAEYENYPINNHRRMRSKELHYLDHPLVGMLIQINPVKNHTEKAAVEPAAQ